MGCSTTHKKSSPCRRYQLPVQESCFWLLEDFVGFPLLDTVMPVSVSYITAKSGVAV